MILKDLYEKKVLGVTVYDLATEVGYTKKQDEILQIIRSCERMHYITDSLVSSMSNWIESIIRSEDLNLSYKHKIRAGEIHAYFAEVRAQLMHELYESVKKATSSNRNNVLNE